MGAAAGCRAVLPVITQSWAKIGRVWQVNRVGSPRRFLEKFKEGKITMMSARMSWKALRLASALEPEPRYSSMMLGITSGGTPWGRRPDSGPLRSHSPSRPSQEAPYPPAWTLSYPGHMCQAPLPPLGVLDSVWAGLGQIWSQNASSVIAAWLCGLR